MRPAYSVILFTTLSGAGYGLLAVLGAMLLAGAPPGRPFAALAVGLALASAGLIASTLHLGRPERAWRAFSQWRTSWLSREGVAALAVYAAALPLGGLLLWRSPDGWPVRALAAAIALLALATVACTAMIYGSLKPVRQWRHPTVLAAYLLLSLASGTLVLDASLRVTRTGDSNLQWLALLALSAAWFVKEIYWRAADHPGRPPTAAAAIGLERFGEVRLLDAPHTESNYLLQEMGYQVARKHTRKLRRIVRGLGFALPIATILTLLELELPTVLQSSIAVLAALAALLGILVERWLFFAEATHTVTLYYGSRAV